MEHRSPLSAIFGFEHYVSSLVLAVEWVSIIAVIGSLVLLVIRYAT